MVFSNIFLCTVAAPKLDIADSLSGAEGLNFSSHSDLV